MPISSGIYDCIFDCNNNYSYLIFRETERETHTSKLRNLYSTIFVLIKHKKLLHTFSDNNNINYPIDINRITKTEINITIIFIYIIIYKI